MNLYLNGSNREENCYKILNDLKSEKDLLFSLADKSINYCLGCGACANQLKEFCIIEDDMQMLYKYMLEAEKIVIATPIYMNHITGILKNIIDRWNPYTSHAELLKGKKIYIITVGQMSEKENEDIATNIKEYFEGIGEFMEFDSIFLKNFSSGELDNVQENYIDYEEIVEQLKNEIEK